MHSIVAPGPAVPLYLVRTKAPKPTWYALSIIAPRTHQCSTALVAFADRAHALHWAAGLEAYHRDTGHFPSREIAKLPKSFAWLPEAVDDVQPEELELLDVHKLSMADVQAMMKGSGLTCKIVMDPSNLRRKRIDISITFDKAATCTRLAANLKASVTDPRM